MASHEWPPCLSSSKSSSIHRKLTRDALAAVDWHKPRRSQFYSSDGEDELSSPHPRDPLESACQSSGYGEGKEAISSGYGNNTRFGFNNNTALQSSEGVHIFTTHINSSNKEAKVKLPANRRVDHTSLAPHQSSASAQLWLNACPFSGPLKLAGRTHPNRSTAMPVDVANKKNSAFNPKEPSSPEVTCLGHVRIKGKHGHNTDYAIAEDDCERHTREGKNQSVDRNHMAEIKQNCKSTLRSWNEAAEKGGCLARRKRREAKSAVAVLETTETRRERAAALARSLTSLLEDLRKLEMEKEGYEPAVPPPNSLLLMRTNKSCVQEMTMISDEGHSLPVENKIGSDCENTFDEDVCLPGMKMKRENTMELAIMNVQREHAAAQQVLPLSEIKSNSLAQNTSLSEPRNELPVDHYKDRPRELALWQRRAIAKLDAIDTKMRVKVVGIRPATK